MLDVDETVFDNETVDDELYVPELLKCELVAEVVVETDPVFEADRELVVDEVAAAEGETPQMAPLTKSQYKDAQPALVVHAAPTAAVSRRSARAPSAAAEAVRVNAFITRSNATWRINVGIIMIVLTRLHRWCGGNII
jgi:hypothetical protein